MKKKTGIFTNEITKTISCIRDLATFKTAIIEMPGGEVKTIDIENWANFAGDQLQIEATNGKTYYIHASKCIMMT